MDGRRARRVKGRLAVLDAVIDLVAEGHTPPTVDQVAERSGVSVASVFRYFESVEEMQSEAVARFGDRYQHLFMWTPPASDSAFGDRLEALVTARLDLYEAIHPVARFARQRSLVNPHVATRLAAVRADQYRQIEASFATELTPLPAHAARQITDAVAAVVAFEGWDLLHSDLGRSRSEIAATWTSAISSLFGV